MFKLSLLESAVFYLIFSECRSRGECEIVLSASLLNSTKNDLPLTPRDARPISVHLPYETWLT